MLQSANIAVRCLTSLGASIWARAYEDLNNGRVEIQGIRQHGFTATVRGSRGGPFDVEVDWSQAENDDLVVGNCNCPDSMRGCVCRHIAAALLQAAVDGVGRQIRGSGELMLVCGGQSGDSWDDEYEWGDDAGDDAGDDDVYYSPADNRRAPRRSRPATSRRRTPSWREKLSHLDDIRDGDRLNVAQPSALPAKPREICYRLNLQASHERGNLQIDLCQREQKMSGEWGKIKAASLDCGALETLADPADREVLGLLLGSEPVDPYDHSFRYARSASRCAVFPPLYTLLFPRLCATGRFGWFVGGRDAAAEELNLLTWDDGPAWQFKLRVARRGDGHLVLEPVLHRGGREADLNRLHWLGFRIVILDQVLALLDSNQAQVWLPFLLQFGPIEAPPREVDAFVEQLCQLTDLPEIELPDSLGWRRTALEPKPRVVISKPKYSRDDSTFEATVSFDYGGRIVAAGGSTSALVDRETRTIAARDPGRESSFRAQLSGLGLKTPPSHRRHDYDFLVPRKQFAPVVETLTAAGWHVEAEGYRLHRPGAFKVSLSSGVDWFELDAQVDYDGTSVALPELLAAARRGESFVVLGDGTRGMLPEEWLDRYAPLAAMGTPEGDRVRFVHTQALLLDAWLAAQPEVDVDATFEKVRDRMSSFDGVRPRAEPAGFSGTLRDYQRDGLGWLHFLADFDFGGCLADDMGLGKTVQVLALLAEKHVAEPDAGRTALPSLVVVPRSLVHNWIEEARRFTPHLRVLDYTGLGRGGLREEFGRYDVVLTTYGTLRRDAGHLKDVEFHYCILDEAQAIKNSASQAAKACRLLRARHRLAMTGTPVENHLGELWSLFEFLNPGMLGRSPSLQLLSGNGRGGDREGLGLLAKALRPFLLRRTKEQVLSELPEKTEQTLYCELEGKQRKLYDELRDHFRASLAERIESVGLKRAKIHVLEALLRLRQAACHPGLIDRSKQTESSAKLETLFEQLDEVLDEGHKALVFSQFTSLLAIVRRHLDKRGVTYEYLDGRTRQRGDKVNRFQQDPKCKLFLISLKAGGLGLNLTAADYVFILDPWWNPAVEAQAVDRAHRIGQARRVFAYRLIARDTVEEKILELQGGKRKLAEAIVSADNSLIRSLTADDLRLLLS